jgi:hypothetical protein
MYFFFPTGSNSPDHSHISWQSWARTFLPHCQTLVPGCLTAEGAGAAIPCRCRFIVGMQDPSPRCARPSPVATAGEGGAPRCELVRGAEPLRTTVLQCHAAITDRKSERAVGTRVTLAMTRNGQWHGIVAPAPSAVKHPGAYVCQQAEHVQAGWGSPLPQSHHQRRGSLAGTTV